LAELDTAMAADPVTDDEDGLQPVVAQASGYVSPAFLANL
jgi:hypothetical protein